MMLIRNERISLEGVTILLRTIKVLWGLELSLMGKQFAILEGILIKKKIIDSGIFLVAQSH